MNRPAALPDHPTHADHARPDPQADLARLHGSATWQRLAADAPAGAGGTPPTRVDATGGGDHLCFCLLRFDAARFDPAWFDAARITRPPGIAASVPKRQAEYFHGRYAARLAMERLGRPGADVAIGRAREPLWPDGIVGSISHSQCFAAAVATTAGRHDGVGIDIERIVDADAQQALLATAISARELDYLQGLGAGLPLRSLVTIVFSAKESLYKGAYAAVGRFFDFSAAQVTGFDADKSRLSLTLTEELSSVFHRHSVWHVGYRFIDADTVFTSFIR